MGNDCTSKMSQIQFAHVAREWRMKYEENELKGGAVELDKILQEKYLDTIKATKGFVSCQRAVCGGCNDFKVVVKLSVPEFGDWEKGGFVPEAEFLADAAKVAGVSTIETQCYTFEEL